MEAAAGAGRLDVVNLLLEHGADVNLRSSSFNGAASGALPAAADGNHRYIVQALIDKEADVNTGAGSVLRTAVSFGGQDIVKILLEAGADPNLKGDTSKTILQEAITRGELDIISLLVGNGADVNSVGNLRPQDPLLYAISTSNEEAVRLLLENGAAINDEVIDLASRLRPGKPILWMLHLALRSQEASQRSR